MSNAKSVNMAEKSTLTIEQQILTFSPLREELKQAPTPKEKLHILKHSFAYKDFINSHPTLSKFLAKAGIASEIALLSLAAIGQAQQIFDNIEQIPDAIPALEALTLQLLEVEQFYEPIGGIVGYHLTFLELVRAQNFPLEQSQETLHYYKPEGLDLTEETQEVFKAIRWGVEHLPQIAEIYPVGGAGDRLSLLEESTGKPRPAGHLPLLGQTLISLMIHDLQAREFLYYKLFDKQIITPIAMMTSQEKDNHAYIQEMCQNEGWFGRPVESFFLFIQPLVPVISSEGKWVVSGPLQLFLKPGGHGAIWKLAKDKGVFSWLQAHHRTKALVRQVNNPAAGIDHGLLALCGLGVHVNKSMGFASCDRRLGAQEGMDILVEKKAGNGYEYGITNIEYTDFAAKGIQDIPERPGGHYSIFPANTNILFVDLKAVQEALKKCPIPGILVNMKTPCPHDQSIQGGRLESTMQNIADGMLEKFPGKIKPGEQKELKTFITYNIRSKTIVTAKKAYKPGSPLYDTPPGCFYELLQNHEHLFRSICGFSMPLLGTVEDYLEKGPGFYIHFHPALGPLYSVIGQKIRQGSMAIGSELQLDIAELDIGQLHLDGSLLINAECILGHMNGKRQMTYSKNNGKCTLRNVQIQNRGIDRTAANIFWKNQIERNECLRINIQGSGEFYAENVHFNGDLTIEVPDGYKITAVMEKGKIAYRKERIAKPSWHWHYRFDENDRIVLKRE